MTVGMVTESLTALYSAFNKYFKLAAIRPIDDVDTRSRGVVVCGARGWLFPPSILVCAIVVASARPSFVVIRSTIMHGIMESFVVYEDPASDLIIDDDDQVTSVTSGAAASEAAQDTWFDDKENESEPPQPAPTRRALLAPQPRTGAGAVPQPALPKHRSKPLSKRMPFEDVTSMYIAQQTEEETVDATKLTDCLDALSLGPPSQVRALNNQPLGIAHTSNMQDGKQQQRKPVATSTHHKSKAKTYTFSMEAAVRSIR